MNRSLFKKEFNVNGPAVFPVIHVLDIEQALRNVEIAKRNAVAGVFLINHDFPIEPFLPIIKAVREKNPNLWLGLNFLAVTGKIAFPILAKLESEDCRIDGYWADDARIDESRDVSDQPEAAEILKIKKQCGWSGLYFGGTAFKKQREVKDCDLHTCAAIAANWMDVVTTSGAATGMEAGTDKVALFRQHVCDHALGLASGITPENVNDYASDLDAILIATGISQPGDFYNLDQALLNNLIVNINNHEQ